MKIRIDGLLTMSVGLLLCMALMMSVPVMADEADVVRVVKMDPEMLAGINLPVGEPYMDPEDVLDGDHRPMGEILYYGDQLIVEIYADNAITLRFDEPFLYDEFVTVLSGKAILTPAGGVPQEFITGDSFVIPKGFHGTWQTFGHYREIIVIERHAYEEAYGVPED